MIGTLLSRFRLTAKLGEGGMGVVYRAEDTKLGREVAIKVLPEALAADPERVARFEREAKVLASLNHPHIASIYSFESAVASPPDAHRAPRSEGDAALGHPAPPLHFLVMELVEGEDLAKRLARGSIPVDETLRIAVQIAEALEAAHERGIIHRDLKPANVKVDEQGRVKVLDFGLAKALETKKAVDQDPNRSPPSDSPTLTAQMTRAGVVLGTAAYMSPEQVRGRTLDKRSDIWSFGVVLWEMLSGRRLFSGESVSDTLAAVLTRHPDGSEIPPEVPAGVRKLLDRCLDRDATRRLRDIGEARIALEDARSGVPPEATGATEPESPARKGGALLPWSIAAALGLVAIGTWWWSGGRSVELPRRVSRTSIRLPADAPLVMGSRASLAISPDGTLVAYVGGTREKHRLYLRDLGVETVRPVEGTEGAEAPFFPRSGQWVAFSVSQKLLEVATTGGPVQLVTHLTPVTRGVAWAGEDTIIFTPHKAAGLFRMSLTDPRQVRALTTPSADGMIGHCWPDLLPDGRRALVTAQPTAATSWDESHILIVDLASGKSRLLLEGGSHARYLPTGHVVFARGGKLLAAPFDLESGRLTGTAIVVVHDLLTDPSSGAAYFAVSDTGTLVYARGGSRAAVAENLVWVDRQGRRETITTEPRSILNPRLSPDGSRVVMTSEGPSDDVWILDLQRRVFQRATFGGRYILPIWGPGAEEITFASPREAFPAIYIQPLGSQESTKLAGGDNTVFPGSWSPDGRTLAGIDQRRGENWDIVLIDSDGRVRSLFDSPFNETAPRISPDGKWLAFVSDESGAPEVYLASFPDPHERIQASTAGGTEPVWSPDGEVLYYRAGDGLFEVAVTGDSEPHVAPPRLVLEGEFARGGSVPWEPFYDLSRDDERFLMVVEQPPPQVGSLAIVLNWFEELRQRVPAGGG